MKVRFLDLSVRDDASRQDLLRAIETVLCHGRLVLGPEVDEFEEAMARRCRRRYAVGVGSGSEALYLGMRALGIGPGDEVITPALSWIATANAIRLNGAEPVFADIGDDLNINPDSVRRLITSKTRAILPVHYNGRICHMSALREIAEEAGLLLIEDAAQAFGATLDLEPAGSFGDIACFSMNPMKILAACGEAGAVLTDREDLFERLKSLRYAGTVDRETCIVPSLNGRLDTLQAAVLLQRLKSVDREIAARRTSAVQYHVQLRDIVHTPTEAGGEYNVYYTYTILAPRRDELQLFLEAKGIESRVRHRILMPEQPTYRDRVRGQYPNAKRLVEMILSLPMHHKMTENQADYVAESIRAFYAQSV